MPWPIDYRCHEEYFITDPTINWRLTCESFNKRSRFIENISVVSCSIYPEILRRITYYRHICVIFVSRGNIRQPESVKRTHIHTTIDTRDSTKRRRRGGGKTATSEVIRRDPRWNQCSLEYWKTSVRARSWRRERPEDGRSASRALFMTRTWILRTLGIRRAVFASHHRRRKRTTNVPRGTWTTGPRFYIELVRGATPAEREFRVSHSMTIIKWESALIGGALIINNRTLSSKSYRL